MSSHKYQTVDEYIALVAPEHRDQVKRLRAIVVQAIPEAHEVISYNMPAYKYKTILVYFAAYKGHLGFYPTPSAIQAFKGQLNNFKWAKGTIQFSYDSDLPKELIEKICRFRLEEQRLKAL